MKKQNVRTLSLIVCTFTYLLVGAAVFDALESENEARQRALVQVLKKKLFDKYNMTENDYKVLESIIIKSIPHKAGSQWKFAGAFYFSTTVITTIGYGHSTPATLGGKTFCMFYALAGIPLTLVMFQSIGERLNTFVAFALRRIKRCIGSRRRTSTYNSDISETHLILVASAFGTIVMTAGAYAFHKFEKWEYLDALYYCFITLTTIGFGDYVALQKNKDLQDNPKYVVFSLIFILFGLTVISAAMNLLVLRFLTMNTEDERRDEQEAQIAAHSVVHVDGDIITANGSLYSGHPGPRNGDKIGLLKRPLERTVTDSTERAASSTMEMDTTSVCSCSCYQWPDYGRRREKSKRADSQRTTSTVAVAPDRISQSSSNVKRLKYAPTDSCTPLIKSRLRSTSVSTNTSRDEFRPRLRTEEKFVLDDESDHDELMDVSKDLLFNNDGQMDDLIGQISAPVLRDDGNKPRSPEFLYLYGHSAGEGASIEALDHADDIPILICTSRTAAL